MTNPDTCSEVCGDGFNLGMYECDDGNKANKDGCSSECYYENGFTCLGGSSTSKDVCFETCGDGKSMGTLECDDGNTSNGDGCSSNCTIETGYECN